MPTLAYFEAKAKDERVAVADLSGKAYRLFSIAEKVFRLCFPTVHPRSVHCFWNNSGTGGKATGALKFDVHFRMSDQPVKNEFVVEVFVERPGFRVARVLWSELSDGTWYQDRACGLHAGETIVCFE